MPPQKLFVTQNSREATARLAELLNTYPDAELREVASDINYEKYQIWSDATVSTDPQSPQGVGHPSI